MDPFTILAAFLPVIVEGLKGAVSRWIAPDNFKPATIEQYAKMQELDIARFKALSDAGGTNLQTYPWVDASVKLMRPVAAVLVLGTWAVVKLTDVNSDPTEVQALDNFAAAVGFYLFGDRTLFYTNRVEKRS